jgi:hypothetical protein
MLRHRLLESRYESGLGIRLLDNRPTDVLLRQVRPAARGEKHEGNIREGQHVGHR